MKTNASSNENEGKPWDVNKYHRAFVAGLMGAAGASPAVISNIISGNTLEGICYLVFGFFVGFAAQLGIEYRLKPSD